MIREATPADVPAILGLIRELARYEREPDAVETTEPHLQGALFGPTPTVFALVAEHETDLVGCAVWFVNYSTWTGKHGLYLEDLIVREGDRHHGYGRRLLNALARICVDRGYARFEWAVLNWNEPALNFYRALGAKPMSDWIVHRVSGEALTALAESADTRA